MESPFLWSPPPRPLTLEETEVHVWRAKLDSEDDPLEELLATLTPDERSRADRFHFPRDRRRFIAGRGVLRNILGRYVDCPPSDLRFTYGATGKPSLAFSSHGPGIRFNLAHSHDLALYSVTRGREVGIDLELVQPRLADEKSAEGVYSTDEISLLKTLPLEFRVKAFFNGWTRKEAYIKATGKGFSVPTDSFDVSLGPGEPAIFLRGVDAGWSLKDIDAGREYAAAVAAEGNDWCIRQWDWQ